MLNFLFQKEDDQEESLELPIFLQKSSQRSLNDEFRENVFAIPCLETAIVEHSVDHVLLEKVKFVSPFVLSKPISHLYETERPPSPSSVFSLVPLAQCFTLNLLKKRTFVP